MRSFFFCFIFFFYIQFSFSQAMVPADTCACKSLIQFFNMYKTDPYFKPETYQGYYGFDSFLLVRLKLKIPNPWNLVSNCEKSFYAATQNDRNNHAVRQSYPGATWGTIAAAVLEHQGRSGRLDVPSSLVCKVADSCKDLFDPFVCRGLIYQHAEKNLKYYNKYFPGFLHQTPEIFMTRLIAFSEKKSSKKQNKILQSLHHSLEKSLNICPSTPSHDIAFYAKLAMMANSVYIPACLPNIENIKTENYSNAILLENEYLKILNEHDYKRLANLDSLLHEINDACSGSYRKPTSWYLREAYRQRFPSIPMATVEKLDSTNTADLFNYLMQLMRKPQPHILLKHQYFFNLTGYEADVYYRTHIVNFSKSNWCMGADTASLLCHWNTKIVEADRFRTILPMIIEDAKGFKLKMNLYLPAMRNTHQWGYFKQPTKIQWLASTGNLEFYSIQVINYLTANGIERNEYTLEPNDNGISAFVNTTKVDTLSILVEILKQIPKKKGTSKESKKRSHRSAVKQEEY